jgi:hypothetical protein
MAIMAQKPFVIDLPFLPFPGDGILEERLSGLLSGFRSERIVVMRLFPSTSIFCQSEGGEFLRRKYQMRRRVCPIGDLKERRKINVAIHARRGDIIQMMADDTGPWRERYVDIGYFLELAKIVEEACGPENVRFNIISQGTKGEFGAFGRFRDVHYWLDHDVFVSFHALTAAEVIICSPSSFSYLAALLSDGVKLFRSPFWHDIPDSVCWLKVCRPPAECREEIKAKLKTALRLSER